MGLTIIAVIAGFVSDLCAKTLFTGPCSGCLLVQVNVHRRRTGALACLLSRHRLSTPTLGHGMHPWTISSVWNHRHVVIQLEYSQSTPARHCRNVPKISWRIFQPACTVSKATKLYEQRCKARFFFSRRLAVCIRTTTIVFVDKNTSVGRGHGLHYRVLRLPATGTWK